jgi:uncharacterized protein
MYKRKYFTKILERIKAPRNFIQIIYGSRQVGKTTLIKQIVKEINSPYTYVSADDITAVTSTWIDQIWETCRIKINKNEKKDFVLIIDEVQKIPNWSENIKKNWDYDSFNDIKLKLFLLGSAPISIQKGLSESLAGRFELVPITHWSYTEMKEAFSFSIEEYVYYGGYPGAIPMIKDIERWQDYIKNSLVDSVISKDILSLSNILKPTLLRRLLELGSLYSGQILSYNKMLGQLQDVGNTVTIAHYLELLSISGLLTGIEKYSTNTVNIRSSSPKLQVYNNALMAIQHNKSFNEILNNSELWGRFIESAVGAFLLNESISNNFKLYYWRERNFEVDFILEKKGKQVAIEVKSNKTSNLQGIEKFSAKFPSVKKILVGKNGISLEDFLQIDFDWLFDN